MVIDNEEDIVNLRKSRNLIVSFFIILLAVAFLDVIPVTWYYLVLFITILLGIFLYSWHKQNFTYIRYSDNDNFIEFKYYHIVLVSPKRKMIRIKQNLFAKFETEKQGKKEQLYIYQKTKTGLFKYPAINLSAMNEEDRKKLKVNLLKYASQNK